MQNHFLATLFFICVMVLSLGLIHSLALGIRGEQTRGDMRNLAGVFFKESINRYDLWGKYRTFDKDHLKIKILLVPGHEPGYGGTEFRGLKERDINVELAEHLEAFLRTDEHFEVVVARDKYSWHEEFEAYFRLHFSEIAEFIDLYKHEMAYQAQEGRIKNGIEQGVYHNEAAKDVAQRLYGINKWANENGIDIVLHIHFNDYRRAAARAGKYEGFALYVPEPQFSNASTTRVLAEYIFKRLAKDNSISNLPGESAGIVDDQELIAVGAFNTANAVSILIEYGYIYEPQLIDPAIRSLAIKDLAFMTFLGIQDFFGGDARRFGQHDSSVLPFAWTGNVNSKKEIFALQTALTREGFYPPPGKTRRECPRTGFLGSCTKKALALFQQKHGISGGGGTYGIQTKAILTTLYGE